MIRIQVVCGFVLAALAPLAPQSATAQQWPQRAVTLVVPFAAGATSDIVARGLGEHIAKEIGQPVVIENRGGAGGNIAGAAVARAAPDGYTLLLATTGPAANNKLIYKSMAYDPQRDLEPIALIGKSPVILAASNGVTGQSLKELIAQAKSNPGKVSAGYPGAGTLGHITGELLQQRAGFALAQVQYRGSAAIIADLVGSHIAIAIDSMAPYVALVQEKKLKGLAMGGETRWPQLPDVPTLAEAGFPGLEASVWYAFVAPSRTQPEIIRKLNHVSNTYLSTAAAKKLFASNAIQPAGGSPEALKAFIAAEIDKWAPIIKAAKIEF